MKNESINHDGKVVEVFGNKIVAEILVSEACGHCHAKGLCESVGKHVKVESHVNTELKLGVGDSVNVAFTPQLALSSVLLAYVLPLILLFVVMFATIAITGSQDKGCLFGVLTLLPYYGLLYVMKDKLKKTFKFDISPK